jgi:putative glycosyltransferase (TIGR04372 family)
MVDPQPFYDLLIRTNTRLLGNMFFPESPGHMISELDNFLLMRHLGEIDRSFNYLAVLPKGLVQLPEIISAVYPGVFSLSSGVQIMPDDELALVAQEIHAMRPEMAVDVGLSFLKVAIASETERKGARLMHHRGLPRPFYWYTSQETVHEHALQYFRRRAESRNFSPLADIPDLSPALQKFLGKACKKLAVVHIRSSGRPPGEAGNAGTRTDPGIMLETLAYLRDTGYTIVKIGGEPYPEEWERFSVLNYQKSKLRNYYHDILLFKAAKFAMFNATGFGTLSGIIGTPMVDYGTWHITTPLSFASCVVVPSLMQHSRSSRLLKFVEHIQLLRNVPEYWQLGSGSFPHADYTERSPTSEDLLAAAQEAIALGEHPAPRSAEQESFVDLDRKKSFAHIQSRISQNFLERFPELLAPGGAS